MFALLPINPLLSLIISYRELRAKNVRQIAPLIGYLTYKIVPGGSSPPWPWCPRWCMFMIHPGPISSLAPPDIRRRSGQTRIHHPLQTHPNKPCPVCKVRTVCTVMLCSLLWLHVFQESIVWRWGRDSEDSDWHLVSWPPMSPDPISECQSGLGRETRVKTWTPRPVWGLSLKLWITNLTIIH